MSTPPRPAEPFSPWSFILGVMLAGLLGYGMQMYTEHRGHQAHGTPGTVGGSCFYDFATDAFREQSDPGEACAVIMHADSLATDNQPFPFFIVLRNSANINIVDGWYNAVQWAAAQPFQPEESRHGSTGTGNTDNRKR